MILDEKKVKRKAKSECISVQQQEFLLQTTATFLLSEKTWETEKKSETHSYIYVHFPFTQANMYIWLCSQFTRKSVLIVLRFTNEIPLLYITNQQVTNRPVQRANGASSSLNYVAPCSKVAEPAALRRSN